MVSSNQVYQECKQCIMDTSDPFIHFDKDGICQNCTDYFEHAKTKIDRRPIGEVINQIKERSKGKYEAILGISGGTDSTLVAYLAKEHGLNALLVHIDDGWNTDAAKTNVQIIVEKTGYDFKHIKVNKEEYHDLILSYLKAGVVGLEAPTDNGLEAMLHKVIDQYKVKNILSGGNWATEGILSRAWTYDNEDAKNIKAIHKKYGTIPLKEFNLLSITRKAWRLTFGGIKVFRLLNLIDYKRSEAKELLSQKWGWIDYGRKHNENRYTKFIECYIYPRRFGIDKRRAHYSALICNNEMTREQALELLKEPLYSDEELEKEKSFFLSQLEISEEQFEKYMKKPIRSHYEFKTHKWDLKLLRFARRILGYKY